MKRNHLYLTLFFFFVTHCLTAQHNYQLEKKFWMANGPVYSIAGKDQTLFLGGHFSYLGPVNGNSGVVDMEGVLEPAFPSANGRVQTAIGDGQGGWFIGGDFSQVGEEERSYLAYILPDGSVAEDFAYGPEGPVNALTLAYNILFVAGNFQQAGGLLRNRFAAINLNTGTVTELIVEASSEFIRSEIQVMLVHDNKLYLGGTFDSVNGQTRSKLAAIDLLTGNLSDWAPSVDGPGLARIYAMAVHNDQLYVGGWFDTVNGQARQTLAAFDTGSGELTGWNPSTGHFVYDMLVHEETLYICGDFTTVNNQSQDILAALDIDSGELLGWQPFEQQDLYYHLFDLEQHNGILYVAGVFKDVKGSKKKNLAAFDLNSGEMTDWKASTNAQAEVIAFSGDRLLAGGSFKSIGGVDRVNLAAVDFGSGEATDWELDTDLGNNRIQSMLLDGESLYLGGHFQSLNGLVRSHLAAYNLNSQMLRDWTPLIAHSDLVTLQVNELLLNDQTLYVGGNFSTIDDQLRNHLAAFDMATGLLTDWSPEPDKPPFDLAAGNEILYVGGDFEIIGGQARDGLAAFELSNGLLTNFAPEILIECSPDNGGPTGGAGNCIYHIDTVFSGNVAALATHGHFLYLSGAWTSFNGEEKGNLLAVDLSSGNPIDWNPLATVNNFHIYDNQLFMAGSFREDSTEFDLKPAALLNLETQEFQLLDFDPANVFAFDFLKTGGYLILAGNFYLPEEATDRHFAVFIMDAVNQSTEPGAVNKEFLGINVFPNPGPGTFQLKVENFPDEELQLEIFDLYGRSLWQQTLHNHAGQGHLIQNKLPHNGIYFARISAGTQQKTVKLVVR